MADVYVNQDNQVRAAVVEVHDAGSGKLACGHVVAMLAGNAEQLTAFREMVAESPGFLMSQCPICTEQVAAARETAAALRREPSRRQPGGAGLLRRVHRAAARDLDVEGAGVPARRLPAPHGRHAVRGLLQPAPPDARTVGRGEGGAGVRRADRPVRRLFVKTAKFVVGLALVMAVLLKVSTWVFPQDWQLLAAVAVGLAVSRVLARGKVG
jgi:hypothetical protein